MANQFGVSYDTAAAWKSANRIPYAGESCFETDNGKQKIGDGTTAYNSLPYVIIPPPPPPAPMPTNVIAETCSRGVVSSATATSSSGIAKGTLIYLQAGQVINNITFAGGTTAAGTPTHQWFAITNQAGVVQAVTADATTAAWAASTNKTLALTSAWTVPTTGYYYIVRMMAATTTNTGCAVSTLAQLATLAPVLSVVSTTSYTTPPAVGATITWGNGTGLAVEYANVS